MLEASVYFVLEGGDGMVLQNKLGITNFVELAREEERVSKKKAFRFAPVMYLKAALESIENMP